MLLNLINLNSEAGEGRAQMTGGCDENVVQDCQGGACESASLPFGWGTGSAGPECVEFLVPGTQKPSGHAVQLPGPTSGHVPATATLGLHAAALTKPSEGSDCILLNPPGQAYVGHS